MAKVTRSAIGSYLRRQGMAYGSMESMIRPFVTVTSVSRLRPRSAPGEVLPEAFIEWGAPSQFAVSDFREDARTLGVRLADEEEDDGQSVFEYNGTGGDFVDYRVENPGDPDQYVVVRRWSALAFSGQDGEFVLNIGLDPLLPGEEQASGVEPPGFEFP